MNGVTLSVFFLRAGVGFTVALVGVGWLVVNRSWRKATFSGIPISFADVLGMKLRGTPPGLIVDAAVAIGKRGRAASVRQVEAAYLAYGSPRMDGLDLAEG